MNAAKEPLTCDTCPEETTDIQAAMAHVSANAEHKMSAVIDEEGSTISVGINHGDDDGGWDFDEDDDWNAGDQ